MFRRALICSSVSRWSHSACGEKSSSVTGGGSLLVATVVAPFCPGRPVRAVAVGRGGRYERPPGSCLYCPAPSGRAVAVAVAASRAIGAAAAAGDAQNLEPRPDPAVERLVGRRDGELGRV